MRLAQARHGSGRPLVLLHGTGSHRAVWNPVVRLLASERDVIALDLPGFGESPPLAAHMLPSPHALAHAVADHLDELGLERAHVAATRALAFAPGFAEVLVEQTARRFDGGADIDVPVTIAWGEHDRLLPPAPGAGGAAPAAAGQSSDPARVAATCRHTTTRSRSRQCCCRAARAKRLRRRRRGPVPESAPRPRR